jgi:hypothetical protein
MANANAPSGFHPVRHKTGGEIRMSKYTIASEYGTAIGRGTVVELTGTGKNIQVAAKSNVDNIGVFAGCEYVDAQGEKHFSDYWPASQVATKIIAYVWDDPMLVFRCQADSCAEGDVGALADWIVGTPSATTGLSASYLEVNGATATTAEGMRIMGLSDIPNNAYGAYAKIDVMFAEHALLTGANGAAGV